ncbi:MAG: hypothetical protein H6592_14275 [Flavobacteriales bacterium]|nr:hypothetical protein [Flavobacteriales bacterium]
MSDVELLEGLRRHDRKVVEAVYSQVRAGILSYVRQNNGTRDEGLDVVQDAMMVAYVHITKPDFELTAALSTYIQTIGRNLWLKHLDRYKKRYKPESALKRHHDNH